MDSFYSLYGLTSQQTFRYYRMYTNDPRPEKAMVRQSGRRTACHVVNLESTGLGRTSLVRVLSLSVNCPGTHPLRVGSLIPYIQCSFATPGSHYQRMAPYARN